MMPRKQAFTVGACCLMCHLVGAGAQEEAQEWSFEDTVVLIQKASSSAESQQFPNMFMPGVNMLNPMASVMNPMANPMANPMMNPMMNPMANPMINPMAGLANVANSLVALTANSRPMPAFRPKAPGFSVIVDSPVGSNLKLSKKMDQYGITPEQFYANTVVMDKFGMRIPSDKVPKVSQYPLIYKYTEPFGSVAATMLGLAGHMTSKKSSRTRTMPVRAAAPPMMAPPMMAPPMMAPPMMAAPMQAAPMQAAPGRQMAAPMLPPMGAVMPQMAAMGAAVLGPMMEQMMAAPMVIPQYDGMWHRVADADEKFEIHGNLMRWSKQTPDSPPMQLSMDPMGQLTMLKQGVPQTGRLDGFRLLWSDGDVWIREQKVKSAPEQAFSNLMAAFGGSTGKPMIGNRRERDLAFVAVPSNFAREIEQAALDVPPPQAEPLPQADAYTALSMEMPMATDLAQEFAQASASSSAGASANASAPVPEEARPAEWEPGQPLPEQQQQLLLQQESALLALEPTLPAQEPALQPQAEEPSLAADANLEQKGQATAGAGSVLWGEMNEALREKSAVTGCTLAATPPKYWPEELATKYFAFDERQNRTVIGVLRDPYDRLVHEFRLRAEGASAEDASEHQKLYDACDVNSWVKQELGSAKKDAFHADCHFLPQAEYFEGPHGINLPIDGRMLPLSFNEVMERHNYAFRMTADAVKLKCEVSSWSLDAEARALIKEAYAKDFELLCQHFGHCDADEVTCMSHLTGMCGGAPQTEPLIPDF